MHTDDARQAADALTDRIGRMVRQRLRELAMTQSDLARALGVHRAWTTRLIHGGQLALRVRELAMVAQVLGLQVQIDLVPKLRAPATQTHEDPRAVINRERHSRQNNHYKQLRE